MSPRPRKKIDLDTYEGRFARRLVELREKAGLTVEEAAEQIGVCAAAIYDWEKGRRRPDIKKFPKISEVYNLKWVKDLLPKE